MRCFDYTELINKKWDNEVINYLSLIHEYKGKQTSYIQQKTSELNKLVEMGYTNLYDLDGGLLNWGGSLEE